MRLRKIGPIIIGSRVRDTIYRVFLPQAVDLRHSVHLRHETTNRVTAYGLLPKYPATLEIKTPPCSSLKIPKAHKRS